MPKRLLKRYLPDPKRLQDHRTLRWLGNFLHAPNIWHLNRHSVARALAVGLFVAFLPIPFQMLVAAVFAVIFRANLPLSALLVWITNPLTMPAIFFFAYKIGALLMGIPPKPLNFELSWQWLQQQLHTIAYPLLLGSLVCSIVSAILGYICGLLYWKLWIIRNWNKRRNKATKLF